MSIHNSPQIVRDGLTFYYDMINREKSWKGVPTTNLIGDSMSVYNNVGNDVTASLVTTGEYYRGAPIYKLTLTPTTASGVSWLSGGNNPGIGVVTSGGGGTANRYTGHAIFYRSTVPMSGTPLFTNYSNIGGWGAGSLGSNRSVDMGDGWFRGEVLWYDTVTRGDGKYWAINPLSATLNIPIVIYWAGPFKEDLNYSALVSQYTPSTRSTTQALLDLTGNKTLTAGSGVSYYPDGTYGIKGPIFSFNGGANSSIAMTNTTLGNGNLPWTVSAWIRTEDMSSGTGQGSILSNSSGGPVYSSMGVNSGKIVYWTYQNNTWTQKLGVKNVSDLQWHLLTWVNYSNYTMDMYVDGVLDLNVPNSTSGNNNPVDKIGGSWAGNINAFVSSMQIYNIALTPLQVKQNFNAIRKVYGV
jgi:hypothetical protein